jgi:hypothetical protein
MLYISEFYQPVEKCARNRIFFKKNEEKVNILHNFFTFILLVSLETEEINSLGAQLVIQYVLENMVASPIGEYDGNSSGFLIQNVEQRHY